MSTSKQRVDVLLVELGLCPSRAKAQALIMAGKVFVDKRPVDKAGTVVPVSQSIEVRDDSTQFVSRGGAKLAGALEVFEKAGLTVQGKVAADFGASTGGFVDCLLQRGARRVHAIDVGHGLLHEKVGKDPRVVVHDRTNARNLTTDELGEQVELVVIDASFISLLKLLDAVKRVTLVGGELVALIKPQFEAGKREVAKGQGVIRDKETRDRVVREVLDKVQACGFEILADTPSEVPGPKGNVEHFLYGRVLSRKPVLGL